MHAVHSGCMHNNLRTSYKTAYHNEDGLSKKKARDLMKKKTT